MWRFFLLSILSINVFSGLTQYDVYGSNKFYYSFRQICEHYKSGLSLIENPKTNIIECMGQQFDVQSFCQEKFSNDKQYARAYVLKNEEKVICQTAKRIVLKYKCNRNSTSAFCRDAKSGCESMKNALARNLDIIHSALIKRDDQSKDLNCYYDTDIAMND